MADTDFTPITSQGTFAATRLYGVGEWGSGYYGQNGRIGVRNQTDWTEA